MSGFHRPVRHRVDGVGWGGGSFSGICFLFIFLVCLFDTPANGSLRDLVWGLMAHRIWTPGGHRCSTRRRDAILPVKWFGTDGSHGSRTFPAKYGRAERLFTATVLHCSVSWMTHGRPMTYSLYLGNTTPPRPLLCTSTSCRQGHFGVGLAGRGCTRAAHG